MAGSAVRVGPGGREGTALRVLPLGRQRRGLRTTLPVRRLRRRHR
ncbi:hypothetical protein [Streptomyces sp. uw30]|nr:hypothetical protein [Streptomyces sp. uw30]